LFNPIVISPKSVIHDALSIKSSEGTGGPTSTPLAISSGLDRPFWSRRRLEKKRAALAVREVTKRLNL
jgi:hypothetical protein